MRKESSSPARCSVVIAAGNQAERLARTVASVNRQSTRLAVDIVLRCEPGCEPDPLLEVARDMPWSRPARTLRCDAADLPSAALAASTADLFLFLTAGDILFGHAVEELYLACVETQLAAVGARRWSNGRSSWSDPSVDDFFRLPGSVGANHFDHPLWENARVVALVRRRLLHRSASTPTAEIAVVKEYLAESSHEGRLGSGSRYQLSVGRQLRCDGGTLVPGQPQLAGRAEPRPGPWLFGERQGSAAEDNAWALFRYCRERRPDIESYYVLAPSVRVPLPDEYAPYILRQGDERWAEALARASHVLVTDSATDVLGTDTDVSRWPGPRYVFLTHGALLYAAGRYLREHRYFDYLVAASLQDVACASEEWNQPAARFVACGLPRWDHLGPGAGQQREVLFCPTWRYSIDTSIPGDGSAADAAAIRRFRQSAYFQWIASFLTSPALAKCLERHDLTLLVRLHFHASTFLECFRELAADRIKVSDRGTDARTLADCLQDSLALITDYSSIMWDMAYMEKPVICCQWDKPAMLAERERCSFCLPDRQLVADVCYRPEDVIARLDAIASRRFALTDAQRHRLDRLLPRRDQANCRRLVDFLVAKAADGRAREPCPDEPPRQGLASVLDRMRPLEAALAGMAGKEKAAVIGCPPPVAARDGPVWLDTADWEGQLLAGCFDRLLIEPLPDAGAEWGRVFFDREGARNLIHRALDRALQAGIDVQVLWSAVLPFAPEALGLEGSPAVALVPFEREPIRYDVTIIVPVHNGAAHIGRCLDSVLCQQFQGTLEVVVVDDGSDDETVSILADYAADHPNLRVARQPNMRQGMARNHGLLLARGRYVTFVDADDLLAAGAIASLFFALTYHHADLAAGVVASWVAGSASQRVNQAYWHYSQAPEVISPDNWPHVFWDPSCVGKLYRRDFLLDNRLFFPRSFDEDQAFAIALFSCKPICATAPSVVYLYVPRPASQGISSSQQFTAERLTQFLCVARYAKDTLLHAGLGDRVVDHALGCLLVRCDRLIWELRRTCAQPAFSDRDWPRIVEGLQHLLEAFDDEGVIGHCRHHCLFFLCLRHGVVNLAQEALHQSSRAAVAHFQRHGLLAHGLLEKIRSGEAWHGGYEYYRPVAISGDPWQDDVVTDMSYGYRVGRLLSGDGRSPLRWLLTVPQAASLAFDMATRRGREKDRLRKRALLAQSRQALLDHSEQVKATREFQIGVAVMEMVTRYRLPPWYWPRRILIILRRS